jgi:6-pyruvoyltetrahydropterin/6-carboxytetrahydropterin synthase
MAALGAYYELVVCCRGEPDPVTGYLMNISEIDRAVRTRAVPLIERAVQATPGRAPGHVLRELIAVLQPDLARPIQSVAWRLTPFYTVTMETAQMQRFLMTQQFDFAAAHRLHCRQLSEEENRKIFGKCNNAHGHGHNYRLEVTVSAPLPPAIEAPEIEHPEGEPPEGAHPDAAHPATAHRPLALPELERIVDEQVIQRFDHTHLNLDTAEFARLNPSVEHIARVCHDLLAEPIAATGAVLEKVTVWETEKTGCTYPAPS